MAQPWITRKWYDFEGDGNFKKCLFVSDSFITRLAIGGYRSIRSLTLSLDRLNVITGANGSGKSNLYRALKLMADLADGRLLHSLALEGGFTSVLWAGPEIISAEMRAGVVPVQGSSKRKNAISLRLGICAEPFSYTVDIGLPQTSGPSMFACDPEIKRECLWNGVVMDSKRLCADRRRGSLRSRKNDGTWQDIDLPLSTRGSMLTEYSDPFNGPELILMREQLRSWRFYDSFRVDAHAPARQPAPATLTTVMSGDGSDFAAALQTIREIGDWEGVCVAIDHAFPGTHVTVTEVAGGLLAQLEQPGMLRKLRASEWSDGTLRYLLLVTALMTPRPPALMVLNEPEASLHPDLIPPLAKLIQTASQTSQVIVVTHSQPLVDELAAIDACNSIYLQKSLGETKLEGDNLLDRYGFQWPKR